MEGSEISAERSASYRTRGKRSAADAASSTPPTTVESQEAPGIPSATTEKDLSKHRVWEPWNSKTVLLFYEGLKQHGRNFEAIRQYIVGKTKSDAKRSIQVRNFYYNSWQKISGLLDFSYCHSAPKEAKELFALINYGEWLRKTDFESIKDKHVATFNQLVRTGSAVVKLTGPKCSGRKNRLLTIKLRTPACPALKKFMEDSVDVASVSVSHPGKVAVELLPDRWIDREFIADLESNPYLRLSVSRDCTIDAVIELMIDEWKLRPGQREKLNLSKWGIPGRRSEKQEEPFVLNVSLCQDRESMHVATTSSVPSNSTSCSGTMSLEKCFSSESAARDVEEDNNAAFQPQNCSESSPDEMNENADDAVLDSEFWYCSENCGDANVGQLLHVSKLPKILRLRYRLNVPAAFITISRHVRKCLLYLVNDQVSAACASSGAMSTPPNYPVTFSNKRNDGNPASGSTISLTCRKEQTSAHLPLLESHRLLSASRQSMLPRRGRKRRSANGIPNGSCGGLLDFLAQTALDCSFLLGLMKSVGQSADGNHFGAQLLNHCASKASSKPETANSASIIQEFSTGKMVAESFNDACLPSSSFFPGGLADEKHYETKSFWELQPLKDDGDEPAEKNSQLLSVIPDAPTNSPENFISQCYEQREQGPSTSAGVLDTFFDISLTDANSLFVCRFCRLLNRHEQRGALKFEPYTSLQLYDSIQIGYREDYRPTFLQSGKY
ncbi:protein cramped [Trichuris trichiura]|uniref:Protein cramped n=1 Tax=Trichuris trichiura TaxID=36087 RepID=A0A077ZH21_TRITR|nr:protein cramped [Trichuris trichiura]